MKAGSSMTLHIHPRYARLDVNDGQELSERNYRYAELDWKIPIEQTALVCVDCWSWHYSRDCHERIDQITRGRIAPLLAAARRHGLAVVHGPAHPVAEKSPGWLKLLQGIEKQAEYPDSPAWPPGDFKEKQGPYASFARPPAAYEKMIANQGIAKRWYHECAEPIPGEAVILNGEELHRWCAQKRIMHLFYVGFNTNACIVGRNYGIMAMMARGYHGILVRDATTGMEISETIDAMTCTLGQIATLEQFGAYTVTTDQLIASLDART
jgi:nicotinamidase-related amidase